MNKNMTITMNVAETRHFSALLMSIFYVLKAALCNTLEQINGKNGLIGKLSLYYSTVLERQIDNRQTWHLLHAQLAFLMVSFPVECPLLLRMAFAAWFVISVKMCKQVLAK